MQEIVHYTICEKEWKLDKKSDAGMQPTGEKHGNKVHVGILSWKPMTESQSLLHFFSSLSNTILHS